MSAFLLRLDVLVCPSGRTLLPDRDVGATAAASAAASAARDLGAVGANGWLDAELVAPPAMRAGDGAEVTLVLRSTSASVEGVDVAVHGLSGVHLGLPAGRVVLRPGFQRQLTARLQLPTTAPPGQHQLVLELRRQLDPDDTQLVPFEIDVLAAPVPVLALRRSTIRRRGRVRIENPSDEPIRVALTGSVNGAAFRFKPTVLALGPGASDSARLRLISKGRFGRRSATVSAATANASSSVDATVVGRSRSGPFVAALVAVVALVAAVTWAAGSSVDSPDPDTAAARRDETPSGSGRENGSATSPGSTDGGSKQPPGTESAAGADPSTAAPGAVPGVVPGAGAGASGTPAAADCATPDGLTGWALRGRIFADGLASVVARPAGMSIDFATTTTTDDTGRFAICPLEVGDYLVTVLSEGYYPLIVPARLTGASADLGELELEPGGASLIGTVAGPAGPVDGATVIVRVGRREVGRASTDETGEYLVIGVPAPTDITVEVRAPGLATTSFSGEVLTEGRIRQAETHMFPA